MTARVQDPPATKTEVRAYCTRIREDLCDLERALRSGDAQGIIDAAQDASGAAAEIESMLTETYGLSEPRGINGVTPL